MKMMMKLFAIVALLAMTASCVTKTAPTALPDKYNLTDLKEVKKITVLKESDWIKVDNHALIFRDNENNFFLIVLGRPLETSIEKEVVGIIGQGQDVYAGIAKFFIKTNKGRDYYIIQKIYTLDGPEQAKQIKERLSK